MKIFPNEQSLPGSGKEHEPAPAARLAAIRRTSMQDLSLVITRPAFHAGLLARRITDRGFDCTVFPLLDIGPAPNPTAVSDAIRHLEQYAMVILSSPSAVWSFMKLVPFWPLDVAIGLLGEGSLRRLEIFGLSPGNARLVLPAPGATADSESLLERLDLEALKGKRVLIVRAETGRRFLTDALLANGTVVDHLAAYRRMPPKLDRHRIDKLLHLVCSRNDWVITSAEAISVLLDQVRIAAGHEGLVAIRQQHLIVSHARIREAALHAGFSNITLSGATDEDLIDTICSLAPQQGKTRRHQPDNG